MKLTKKSKEVVKKSKSSLEEELLICKENLEKELEVLKKQKELVMSIKRHIFDLEYAPFTEGDTVIIDTYFGSKVKESKCVLQVRKNNLENYEFIAFPFKEDGTLSKRHFVVYNKQQLRYEEGGK